jgi:hypothetical protein
MSREALYRAPYTAELMPDLRIGEGHRARHPDHYRGCKKRTCQPAAHFRTRHDPVREARFEPGPPGFDIWDVILYRERADPGEQLRQRSGLGIHARQVLGGELPSLPTLEQHLGPSVELTHPLRPPGALEAWRGLATASR